MTSHLPALPGGWTGASLREVAAFEMGQAPPGSASNFSGQGTIFVKAGEFGKDYPVVREWTTAPLKYARAGDVLICVVGATAGKLNLGIDCAIGRSVAAIRPNGVLLQKIVYRQLQARVASMRAGSTGSAQGVISKEMLAELPIVIPPQREQQRIADKVDTLLARVETCRDRLARVAPLLKRFRQSVLVAGASGQLTRDLSENAAVGCLHLPTVPDSGVWAKAELPGAWSILGFSECFTDVTDSTRKLPQKLYQPSGTAPVVDQGSMLIGGYTDEVSLLCRERPPLIVFGDHTRCVKWIDFPFVQGADGVKVLRAMDMEPKFAFLLLLAI